VSIAEDSIRTRVVTFDTETFYYSDGKTAGVKDIPFLFIRQNVDDAQLRIAAVTRFSWYFAANTTFF